MKIMWQKIPCLWLGLSVCVFLQSCRVDDRLALVKDPQNMNVVYDLALDSKLHPFQSISDGYIQSNEPPPVPNKALERLGYTLFYERMLYDNKSCSSCHDLNSFGIEGEQVLGTFGQNRNIPSVLNAALDSVQFWHGNGNLHIHMQQHLGKTTQDLTNKFLSDSTYVNLFEKAFPGGGPAVTYGNLLQAIASFEGKLKTPSAFDRYLDGDHAALSLQQKRGLLTFINVGCVDCHFGAPIGGDLNQKFGVFHEYWKYTKSSLIDEGLYAESRKIKDKYVFSVPSLRNVEKTAPYFHDGSVHDLKDAVKIMAIVQLDYALSDEELENIAVFLESLTGDSLPVRYRSSPNLN